MPPSPPEPPRRPVPPRDFAQEEQAARLLTVANIQFRRGQTAEAEKSVGELLQARPNDAAALELLADIKLARNDFDGATEFLKRALEAEPGRATAEAKLARAALRRTERERIKTMGVAYAASDASLMRLSEGGRKSGQWAALGSAFIPGLGQYVNGEPVKGIILAVVYFLGLLLLSQAFVPTLHTLRGGLPPLSGLSWVLIIVLTVDWVYAIADAALASRRAASSQKPN